MTLSSDGLRVRRDAGDQLFSISAEKWMRRMDSNCSVRDSGRRFQVGPLERFVVEQTVERGEQGVGSSH